MKRAKHGKIYQYKPVGYDLWDSRTNAVDGEYVKVVNVPGCPKAGTMGHCHIQTRNAQGEWTFSGLVLLASLQPRKGK